MHRQYHDDTDKAGEKKRKDKGREYLSHRPWQRRRSCPLLAGNKAGSRQADVQASKNASGQAAKQAGSKQARTQPSGRAGRQSHNQAGPQPGRAAARQVRRQTGPLPQSFRQVGPQTSRQASTPAGRCTDRRASMLRGWRAPAGTQADRPTGMQDRRQAGSCRKTRRAPAGAHGSADGAPNRPKGPSETYLRISENQIDEWNAQETSSIPSAKNSIKIRHLEARLEK